MLFFFTFAKNIAVDENNYISADQARKSSSGVYENTLHQEQIEQAKNIAVDENNYISANGASPGAWGGGGGTYETRFAQ